MTWSFCLPFWRVAWEVYSEVAVANRRPPQANSSHPLTKIAHIDRSINQSRFNRKPRIDRNGPGAAPLGAILYRVAIWCSRSDFRNVAGDRPILDYPWESWLDAPCDIRFTTSDDRPQAAYRFDSSQPIRCRVQAVEGLSLAHQCCKSSTANRPAKSDRLCRGIELPCKS